MVIVYLLRRNVYRKLKLAINAHFFVESWVTFCSATTHILTIGGNLKNEQQKI